MRYFAETTLSIKSNWIKNMFPMRHIQILRDDLISFEYDASQDSFLISDLADNPDISRVYLETRTSNYKFESSLVDLTNKFRLMWYGRCDAAENEYGDTLTLADHASNLESVWKPHSDSQAFVSWSSKVHASVSQPFSEISEGKLYLFKSGESTPFTADGLTDTNETEKLGVSKCNYTSNFISSALEREYNLIWYGVCDDDSVAYCNLVDYPKVKEVYQFSNEGSSFNGMYFSNDLTKSTITKLQFGNGYLVRLEKNTTETIPNCAVSDHAVLNTFAPVHPLRLQNCTLPEPTPTPEPPTPTPFNSVCCGDRVYTRLVDGVAEDKNYVSVVGSPDGILCWDEITQESSPQQYSVSFGGSNYEDGGISISTYGNIDNKIFRFETLDGVCYQGTLSTELNVFNIAGDDPVATPTPQTTTTCCSELDVSIAITKEMAESSNPSGPAGITISGFQEGGVLCMSNLTETTESMSCMLLTADQTIGGLITMSVKPNDYNIRYKTTSGICYSGVLQNTTNEHQILTEV